MKHLVIGKGEIGTAIASILKADVMDVDIAPPKESYDVIHICFPYSEDFVEYVNQYKERFTPNLTIIHSTVPLGTSFECDAVHSPVRGVHPHLEEGIRTFVKFFGGKQAEEASKIFEAEGIETYCTPHSADTEAGKIWSTTQYGAFIELNKEIHEFCKENNVNFDVVYRLFNETYNEGYLKLGRKDVLRPVLYYSNGKIGGHCVVPNAHFIDSHTPNHIISKDEER